MKGMNQSKKEFWPPRLMNRKRVTSMDRRKEDMILPKEDI
jgi:hypothetical protein